MLDRSHAKLHIGNILDEGTTFEIDPASLTKHTIILGATGSGKTVLSKVVVEEAALLGIPIFAIDPKGDIGNLAFKSANFNFSKWSGKEADALGIEKSEYSIKLQKTYNEKMQEFGTAKQKPSDFAGKVLVRIFTPKSSAGLSAGISPDLSAPKNFDHLLKNDATSAADLLDLTSYSLLRLAGFGEDDRKEVTFVSAILEDAWKNGKTITIKELIRYIENPPFSSIGSLHVSKVVSDKERRGLATRINLLISDPKLRSWSSAESLNFSELLSKANSNGMTPINIVDLRNIQSEQEKHMFVELILQKMFQWLIKQGSTQTLRYLLYFDEIAGYCPPVREPPSKKLLLLLIKQARAFGLGILLASQNAIDLDYKVISNANVRFIGRLGAQRDIQRVSTGLELGLGAEDEIARLRAGEFLCNVFDPKFKSIIKVRWPLTYHRGPLEDDEIAELMSEFKAKKQGVTENEEAGQEVKVIEEPTENLKPQNEAEEPVQEQAGVQHEMANDSEVFLLLNKKYEPKNLLQFVKLGSNLKSIKVLAEESEERFYPIFELSASVFEKKYAKQSLDRLIDLTAFDGLVPIPAEHSITSQRLVPTESRKDSELWKGEAAKKLAQIKKDLADKFDVLMEEKRKENIQTRSEPLHSKISQIDASSAHLQETINRTIDSTEEYKKIYRELKNDVKKKQKSKTGSATIKSRLISVENKIGTNEQKVLSTRRKIEQLHANREALEEKLNQIREDEDSKFHMAIDSIKSKEGFQISGWLVEIVYRARILVNEGKEHYGDVRWSSYTGRGTWGRCSTCSVALEEGTVCSCGNMLCSKHLAYCKLCLEPACADHRSLCYICNSTFCAMHSIKCEICRSSACSDHSGTCTVCNRKVCNKCSQKRGFVKRQVVCTGCSSG